jgi:hypothetical protein
MFGLYVDGLCNDVFEYWATARDAVDYLRYYGFDTRGRIMIKRYRGEEVDSSLLAEFWWEYNQYN